MQDIKMEKARGASRSAVWLISAQAVIGIGQFSYGAVTARIYAPSEFGAFVAALSLQGLIMLLTTTGIPSFILRQENVGRGQRRTLRLATLIGAVLSAAIFWSVSPFWLSLLQASEGMQFIPLLVVAQFLAPMASTESALLRRNAAGSTDAIIMVCSFVVSAAAGIACIEVSRSGWALALMPVINHLLTGAISLILQPQLKQNSAGTDLRKLVRYSSSVTVQNMGYLLIQQAPGWILSRTAGPAMFGNFSRATTFAGTPGAALANAFTRAMQPFWRSTPEGRRSDSAVFDVVVIVAGISFPLFGILSCVSPQLTALWLGPGWEAVGPLAAVLAIAYGVHVPMAVLASSVEMQGHLSSVKAAQACMAAAMLVMMSFYLLLGNVVLVPLAVLAANIFGLLGIVLFRPWSHTGIRFRLIVYLVRQAAFAIAISLVSSMVTGSILAKVGATAPTAELLYVLCLAVVGAGLWIVCFRLQGLGPLFKRRGMRLPGFMR